MKADWFGTPMGLPLFFGPFLLGVSTSAHLVKTDSVISHTFGKSSSGTFGLFLDPGGLPLGFPVYPRPRLAGFLGLVVWITSQFSGHSSVHHSRVERLTG